MDLAMIGRDEQTKEKPFLIYHWQSRTRKLRDIVFRAWSERASTLKDVIDAFEQHCNPKKNETSNAIDLSRGYKKPQNHLRNLL